MTAPNWQGRTAVVVCAGPSLSDEQLDAISPAECKIIAVNTAYLYAPWAEVVYAGDMMFWRAHYARIKAACDPKVTQMWTQDSSAAERYQINRQRAGNREGLGREVIHLNGNSGFQAINLAYLWGAKKILLVGMDMKLGPNGERHRHGDHEKGLVQAQLFHDWLQRSVKFAEDLRAAGCDVVNCTPGSALTCFPFASIEEALQ